MSVCAVALWLEYVGTRRQSSLCPTTRWQSSLCPTCLNPPLGQSNLIFKCPNKQKSEILTKSPERNLNVPPREPHLHEQLHLLGVCDTHPRRCRVLWPGPPLPVDGRYDGPGLLVGLLGCSWRGGLLLLFAWGAAGLTGQGGRGEGGDGHQVLGHGEGGRLGELKCRLEFIQKKWIGIFREYSLEVILECGLAYKLKYGNLLYNSKDPILSLGKADINNNVTNNNFVKDKSMACSVPIQSPSQVLTMPNDAWLQKSVKNRYFHHRIAIDITVIVFSQC